MIGTDWLNVIIFTWLVGLLFIVSHIPTACHARQHRYSSIGIACFECFSLDGNQRDCEDEFGPHNKTEHLINRNCRVGYLKFRAHYCVKIKGVKDNGQRLVIRTCSVDNWGTQCGDIMIDQGSERYELITGCLASCDHDGCNGATYVHSNHVIFGTILLLFIPSAL